VREGNGDVTHPSRGAAAALAYAAALAALAWFDEHLKGAAEEPSASKSISNR
jgi:hypothetical protein